MRNLVMAAGVALWLAAMPLQCEAAGLFGWNFGGAQTTYSPPYVASAYAGAYRPLYGAAGCTSCSGGVFTSACAPQTCYYVPQTCYRTVYRTVPVTTCRPVTWRNFWTGCPVTTYRPVVSWTRQATVVPYTTYRLVYSNPCNPCGSYGSCGGGAMVYPSGVYPSGCASCASGPVSTPVTPIVPYGGSLGTGTNAATNGVPTSTTFDERKKPIEEKPIVPIPKADATRLNSTPAPNLIDPRDHTTSRPVTRATYVRAVSSAPSPGPSPAPAGTSPKQYGVWRALHE